MICYRLAKSQYIHDLSGNGAYIHGGRWNNKGVYMVYTAESRALAMAEAAVHLPLHIVPKDYMVMEITFPDSHILELDSDTLKNYGWVTKPPSPVAFLKKTQQWMTFPYSPETQTIGDEFILRMEHLALKVPSMVVEGDFNYLLNPQFPNFQKLVKTSDPIPFPFDKRLFVRPK